MITFISPEEVCEIIHKIDFQTEDGIAMPRLRKNVVRTWLNDIANNYGKVIGELSYKFCGDEHILEANRTFLDHDYYTDILTFDSSQGDTLSADILISVETVRSNARVYGTTFQNELHRVLAHGLLHLIGLKDKTDIEALAMRQAEESALDSLRNMLPAGSSLFHQ